jgi:carbon-monoxide dehydrogenase small subunit
MAKVHVSATLNGEPVEFLCDPRQSLLQILRDELELTGTKEGCATGDCGACSVTVDGRLVSSCLTLAVACDGKKIETIEGLAKDGALHPLQQAFVEYGGLQCGICTPGQIIAAKALLDSNPNPTEDEIKEWMAGNLCRCTGYYKIMESILAVMHGKVAAAQPGAKPTREAKIQSLGVYKPVSKTS